MVSYTPLNSAVHAPLPRRDLIAIFAFLNRKGEAMPLERNPFDQDEGVLQQLAAAARMQ